ncbi:MAG: class I SAM-dependent methyltransferase [Planctomycetes bacterium]|nr:class I SAM-dependent methyltransferase [Planctomycetota bacterium]
MPGLYGRRVWSLPPDLPEVDVPPCPACDARRARPAFAIEGLEARIVVCPGCGLGRMHPMPTEEEVRAFYPAEYYGEEGRKFVPIIEAPLRLVGARHVRFLVRDLPRGARVLDVGCGRGVLLSALADRGLEAHGVELSEAAARGADPRAEVRIAPTLAEAGYPDAFFDRVIIWHVFEHLRDPRATLAEVRRVLRPGGEVVVSVPNFSSAQARWAGAAWFHLDPPRHLWHFTLDALRRLLEREGLPLVAEHHFSLRQNPFGWVQSALNRVPGLPRNALYELLQTGGPPGAPLPLPQRLALRAVWLAALGPVVGLSVVEAALRSGATVCVVGRAR